MQKISQVSLSRSRRGVLRGVHCSKYSKLVTVTKGSIYDVVVDLRPDSPTFRRWCAVTLSSENKSQVHVPAGCGHAFLCIQDADVLYLQGGCFDPPNEIDINPFDEVLDIHWPKLSDISEYIMSAKDKAAPMLHHIEKFKEKVPKVFPTLRRVLVIGGSGQVGGALLEAFGNGNVIGTFSTTPCEGMVHFDLQAAAKNPSLADDLINLCQPRIVCICAGRTWVDGCENEGELPRLVNSFGPAAIVRAAKQIGARCVYYSTDYVFDGSKHDGLYTEEDTVAPLNEYGESKLLGERAVLLEDSSCLVLRTTGVYGPERNGKNFVYQLCNAIHERHEILCPTDSFGSPTYNRDLARMTLGLLEARASGVFHCTGPEIFDRYAFAHKVASLLELDSSYIKATTLSELHSKSREKLGFAARRGKHLGLASEKVTSLIPQKLRPRSVEEAFHDWKANPGAGCKALPSLKG